MFVSYLAISISHTRTEHVKRGCCFSFIMCAVPQGSTTHLLDLCSWKKASFHLMLFFFTHAQPISCFLHFHMSFNEPRPGTNELTDPKLIRHCSGVCVCEREYVHKCVSVVSVASVCLFNYMLLSFQAAAQSVAIWLVVMVMNVEYIYTIIQIPLLLHICCRNLNLKRAGAVRLNLNQNLCGHLNSSYTIVFSVAVLHFVYAETGFYHILPQREHVLKYCSDYQQRCWLVV